MPELKWIHFDKITTAFLTEAPVRYEVAIDTSLSQQQLWNAFADAKTWPHWFPKVTHASYDGPAPYDVGTMRRSIVDGIHYEETMLIWDEPQRWGYRIDKATSAISRAQLELTEFEKMDSGTRVKWILACNPIYPINKNDFEEFLEKLLAETLEKLEKYLQQ